MNPDVSKAFDLLRNLVPVKGKMVHSHNGYRMYDLENVRVVLDADEGHDTVNLLGDKQLLGWTISRMKGQFPKVVYNLFHFKPEDILQFAEDFAARHSDKRS